MRLIHYSTKPLTEVRSRAHSEDGAGAYKTPGLWVSVEGDDDWVSWCKGESWGLDGFRHATEIVLAKDHTVLRLKTAGDLDNFTHEYAMGPDSGRRWARSLNWLAVREKHQGLIIAPYQWDRRLADHTGWYYGWDCASGVIWDAAAVAELRPAELPDLSQTEAA